MKSHKFTLDCDNIGTRNSRLLAIIGCIRGCFGDIVNLEIFILH